MVADHDSELGDKMHRLMTDAFGICRSITGDGVRQTLAMINKILPLTIHEVPSHTQVFDWTVPKEWNIQDAYIADEQGVKIIDFNHSNLHVVGYSVPVDQWMTLSELQPYLYSLEDQPTAIPYITSYYKERWGFCLTYNQRKTLKEGNYHVVIDSTLADGSLTYGECLIKGESEQEVLLSTYVCHPSMANNELSGPVVAAYIGQWLASQPRKYSYRIVFLTETIGAITYLSRHLAELKKNCIAGFNLTCIGDERGYSWVASRYGNTLADRVAANVLSTRAQVTEYSFLQRGSDERQYCSPGVDLPVVTLCRSKFAEYPEYHTSLDDLTLVTPSGLAGGWSMVKDCITLIENNHTYQINCLGEPQLGKRGLYPDLSTKQSHDMVATMMDFIAYADGNNDLLTISEIIGKPVSELLPIAEKLQSAALLNIKGVRAELK